MKKLIILLAAGGILSGCVGYAVPYNEPVYGNSPVYRTDDGRHRRVDRDIDRDGIPNRVDRDRDGDGIPNRADRDRDGDGVPNRVDRRPNNPYNY
jgi:Thrombospondin type 3 repeat